MKEFRIPSSKFSHRNNSIWNVWNTCLKILKSEDVEDADRLEVLLAPDAVVEFAYDPGETLRVKCHGHGVPGIHRLAHRK